VTRKPLVAVIWNDAHGSVNAELEEHELPSEPATMTTYGLLVKECEAGIVVACEETQNRAFRGWTFIPKGMIVSITPLGKPQRARTPKAPVASP
jgi:hypothetical protein